MEPIKLSTPVSLGGNEISDLVFKREPNLGDLRACSIDPATILTIHMIIVTGKGGLSQDQLVQLSARLSGQSEKLIEEISARDLLAIHDTLIDFFSPAEEDSAGQQDAAKTDASTAP